MYHRDLKEKKVRTVRLLVRAVPHSIPITVKFLAGQRVDCVTFKHAKTTPLGPKGANDEQMTSKQRSDKQKTIQPKHNNDFKEHAEGDSFVCGNLHRLHLCHDQAVHMGQIAHF